MDDLPAIEEKMRDIIRAAPRLHSIVYLSTIGVYGDHRGAWIDEHAAPARRRVSGDRGARPERERFQWW